MPIKYKWTREQEVYLLSHYQDETLEGLARHVGVSAPTVSTKLRSLGVSLNKRHTTRARKWSEYELNYLYDHFATESAIDIGEHLGMCNVLVSRKAQELGLKKSPSWSKSRYNNRYVKNYKHNINHRVA